MSVLEEILSAKRDEVTVLHQPTTRSVLQKAALAAPPAQGFAASLRPPGLTEPHLRVIAEFKRRSPSRGDIALDLDVATTVSKYVSGGASALSVLTDGPFFGGSARDLQNARLAAPKTPILRKDFVIDPVQVYESVALGADAILLILAALPDDALLIDLLTLVSELGRDALVEVHNREELDRAKQLEVSVIGINARNLITFSEDLDLSEQLVADLPMSITAVAESAIKNSDDARRMGNAGFDAILVGEALVKNSHPESLVKDMTSFVIQPRD